MRIYIFALMIFASQAFAQSEPNCEPVLQKQFAAIMNAQSGWKLLASDISVGSLVEGLYTVVASPKVGQKGSEYLVAIWGERDCRITSIVEAEEEKSSVNITWRQGR